MSPMHVPAGPVSFGRRLIRIVPVHPHVDVEQIALLCPEQARERLSLNPSFVFGSARGMYEIVELVGFAPPQLDDLIQVVKRGIEGFGGQPQLDNRRTAGRNERLVVQTCLASYCGRIDRVFSVDDVSVKCVLLIRR